MVCGRPVGAGEEGKPDDTFQEPQEDHDQQEQPAQRTASSHCQVCTCIVL